MVIRQHWRGHVIWFSRRSDGAETPKAIRPGTFRGTTPALRWLQRRYAVIGPSPQAMRDKQHDTPDATNHVTPSRMGMKPMPAPAFLRSPSGILTLPPRRRGPLTIMMRGFPPLARTGTRPALSSYVTEREYASVGGAPLIRSRALRPHPVPPPTATRQRSPPVMQDRRAFGCRRGQVVRRPSPRSGRPARRFRTFPS